MSQEHTSLSDTAGQVVAQAGDKVGQAVDKAKEQTTSRLEDGREQVAQSLYTTAHVLRQAGQQLREQEQTPIATLADRTAEQAERGSGYLRGRDVPSLLDDTEQLGRTHPVLFTGGVLALGLLGVRFLKSSRRPQQQQATPPQLPAPTPPTPPMTPPAPPRGPAVAPPVRVSDDAPIPPVLASDAAGRAPSGTGARDADAEDARRRAQASGQRTPGTPGTSGTPGGRPRDTPAGS